MCGPGRGQAHHVQGQEEGEKPDQRWGSRHSVPVGRWGQAAERVVDEAQCGFGGSVLGPVVGEQGTLPCESYFGGIGKGPFLQLAVFQTPAGEGRQFLSPPEMFAQEHRAQVKPACPLGQHCPV